MVRVIPLIVLLALVSGGLTAADSKKAKKKWKKTDGKGQNSWVLKRFDANKNGKLDANEKGAVNKWKEERTARNEARRKRIEEEGHLAAHGGPVGEWLRAHEDEVMERFDENGDGELQKDEIIKAHDVMHKELLRRYDADGDGRLKGDEKDAAKKDAAELRRKEVISEEVLGNIKERDPLFYSALDEDGDGTVKIDEAEGFREEIKDWVASQRGEDPVKKAFQHLDVDGDGTITFEEFEARWKKRDSAE